MPINTEHVAKLAAHLRTRGAELKGEGRASGSSAIMRPVFSRHSCGTVGCIAGENSIMHSRRARTGLEFRALELDLFFGDSAPGDALFGLVNTHGWPREWQIRYERCSKVSIGAELMCMAAYLEFWAEQQKERERAA